MELKPGYLDGAKARLPGGAKASIRMELKPGFLDGAKPGYLDGATARLPGWS